MIPKFKFFLVKGHKVLGAAQKCGDGYAILECFPKDTNCYKNGGLRMRFEQRCGLTDSTIKRMVEDYGWEIESEMPFE